MSIQGMGVTRFAYNTEHVKTQLSLNFNISSYTTSLYLSWSLHNNEEGSLCIALNQGLNRYGHVWIQHERMELNMLLYRQ